MARRCATAVGEPSNALTGSGSTDDETFDNEDRPSGSSTSQWNSAALGDPGTNVSSGETATSKGDNVDDGTADLTNGTTTGETDDFTDSGKTTDNTSFNAVSDTGPAAGPVTPSLPALNYTRLLIWTGPWSLLGVPPGYSGGQVTQGSASLTTNDTDNGLETGGTTVENGQTDTKANFSNTDISGESAGVSNSGSGSMGAGGGSYQTSYNGTETGSETDTSGGTLDDGVTTDGYSDLGTQTDTITSSTSYTSPSGSGGTSYNGTDTQITNESGGYTTEPPGGPAPPPSPDNPNGDATNKQSIGYAEIMSSSFAQTASAAMSIPGFTEHIASAYTANDALSVSANSGVNVNVAQNIDTQSGGYRMSAAEWQTASLNDQESWGAPYSTSTSGTLYFQDDQVHSGYNNDAGSFGSVDTDTQGSQGSSVAFYTDTTTYYNTLTGEAGPTVTLSGLHVGGGDPTSTTTTGQAGAAPVDGDPGAGLYTQQTAPYDASPYVSRNVDESPVGAFFKGGAQGGLNIANGVTDIGIGLLNFGIQTSPLVMGARAFGHAIPEIPKPDWSRGIITHESDGVHNASKIIGGNAVLIMPWTKLPGILGSWSGAAKGAIVGRSAAAANAAQVAAAERAAASSGTVVVASSGQGILPAQTVRVIKPGEKIADLVKELAQRTYESNGLEHAIVSLKDGTRVIVQGGEGGITLMDNVRRVILHTHPSTTGPSGFDFLMLKQLGQKSSWIYELFGGGLSKFWTP